MVRKRIRPDVDEKDLADDGEKEDKKTNKKKGKDFVSKTFQHLKIKKSFRSVKRKDLQDTVCKNTSIFITRISKNEAIQVITWFSGPPLSLLNVPHCPFLLPYQENKNTLSPPSPICRLYNVKSPLITCLGNEKVKKNNFLPHHFLRKMT